MPHPVRPLRDRGGAPLGDKGLDFDAAAVTDHLEPLKVVRRGDELLGQAEAEGEVLEIGRRRHHHHMGNAVVHDGDRGFLHHRLGLLRLRVAIPADAGRLQQGARIPQAVQSHRIAEPLTVRTAHAFLLGLDPALLPGMIPQDTATAEVTPPLDRWRLSGNISGELAITCGGGDLHKEAYP
jgi:hypothetical protein